MGQKLQVDIRWVLIAVLLVALGTVVWMWKPWGGPPRTIEVTGKGTIRQQPDEFTFSPYLEKDAPNSQEAIAAVSKDGQAMVAKLKELGVDAGRITTNVSSNTKYGINGIESGVLTGMYSITATATTREVADKVQEYLETAGAQGSISPMTAFSTEAQNGIEKKARDKAIIDAKEKAGQTASAYNAKIGKVKTVTDESDANQPFPMYTGGYSGDVKTMGGVMTADMEYSRSVKVVYELK